MSINKTIGWFTGALLYTSTAILSSPLYAAPLNLADIPLFFGEVVTPNVFLLMDDSGSMDWDILTKEHWNGRAYDPDYGPDDNEGNDLFSPRRVWDGFLWAYGDGDSGDDWGRRYGYAFSNNDDNHLESSSHYGCGGSANGVHSENCPTGQGALNLDWRTRSAALNILYYNPAVDYLPWPGTNGAGDPFPNADFTQARSNPQPGTTGYTLTRDLNGFIYETWVDDKGFNENNGEGIEEGPLRGNDHNQTVGPNGFVDLWDTHTRFTFNADDTVTVETFVYDNVASDGLNPTVTTSTLSGTSPHPLLGGDGGRTIAQARENIANWYQYYRRRSMAVNGATAWVLNAQPNFRYGFSAINSLDDLFVEVPDSATTEFTTHNRDLLNQLFSHAVTGGTPLRSGLERVGRYYDNDLGKRDPIIHSCQQNFTLLFTDGRWGPGSPDFPDHDGDGVSDTLADVAKFYYDKDLSGLPNDVPVNPFDQNTQQHMVTYTVAFGLSGNLVDGDGDGWPDQDRDGVSPITESSNWGEPDESIRTDNVDDLWHAAFNSKGKYVSAQTPPEVVTALNGVLANISKRLSSATTVALNAGSINSESLLFQARFDTTDWSGQLSAYQISDGLLTTGSCTGLPAGEICGYPDTPLWAAHEQLDAQSWNNGREIITFNGIKGIPFRWPADESNPTANELNATQIASLNKDAGGVVDNLGSERVEFLRGKDVAGFRERTHKLGDIIHSSPVYVPAPNFLYPSDWDDVRNSATNDVTPEDAVPYQPWRFHTNRLNRQRILYLAANDGMFHAFDAGNHDGSNWDFGTGEEVMAYVPSLVIDKLNRLTDPDYTHEYFADSTLTAIEVFFSSDWHTVLAGGLAEGAQGVVALDITDPSAFTESNAADAVLWEFGDRDDTATTNIVEGDPDMGYAFHQPVNIVRMHDGKWYALFGNGYNSTEIDGSQSTTGNAVLFIVDIETGSLVRKIDTGVGMAQDPLGTSRPNALATPAPVDVDNDYIIDFVYAGDLFGNLWKFDVTSGSTTNWEIKIEESGNPAPLFVARDENDRVQPITTRPEVGRPQGEQFLVRSLLDIHRSDNLMLYFGTGKYIELVDNLVAADEPTQSFYGIWDPMLNEDAVARSDLLQQTILTENDLHGNVWRTTSNHNIPGSATAWWKDSDGDGVYDDSDSNGFPDKPDKRGWYIDLINPTDSENHGERVSFDSVLRGNRIIFTTIIPSENPCDFGGDSWLMELDRVDGSRLTFTPFDVDQDGAFTLTDYIPGGDVDDAGNLIPVPASGTKHKGGIITTPSIIDAADGSKEFKFTGDTKGDIRVISESNFGIVRRQGWRQIQE